MSFQNQFWVVHACYMDVRLFWSRIWYFHLFGYIELCLPIGLHECGVWYFIMSIPPKHIDRVCIYPHALITNEEPVCASKIYIDLKPSRYLIVHGFVAKSW